MNYRHLRVFWTVARSGGVVRAAAALHLTPQTVSAQLSSLEEKLGRALVRKAGRRLELTDDGRVVLRYADAIFALGAEVEQAMSRNGDRRGVPLAFRVGVVDAVPRSVAYRLLAPAAGAAPNVRLECRGGTLDALTAELALHHVDLVIADAPLGARSGLRAYSHPLGRSGVAFFAPPRLTRGKKPAAFPAVLDRLPLLLPGNGTALAGRLARWLEGQGLAPRVAGRFDDGALMKTFGQRGHGVFAAPAALTADIVARYGVACIGRADDLIEEYFAISAERRITHPCIAAVTAAARDVFGRATRRQA